MATSPKDNASVINTFSKGMMKDLNETFVGEGVWLHARNAVNNSHDGQVGVLGNEPANLHTVDLPYTLIGSIPITDGTWALFTTDNVDSEIGIFDANLGTYKTVVNDRGLNFHKNNLITGASRKGFDCGYKVYFDDGRRNPSRVLDLDNVPYVTKKVKQGECYIEQSTGVLDVEQMRLAQILTIPCVNIEKGKAAGTLRNGSYQVAIAYSINSIRVTDYLVVSEVQGLFDHDGEGGSLTVDISNTDQDFDEFELVLISVVNNQTTAKRLGIYSVNQNRVYIDSVEPDLITVPLELIPLVTPAIESSDATFRLNNYLVRVGIQSKFDFNYQPLANKIQTKWASVEYPANYYLKGGNNTGYMRDEQYAFFIRWIYNTGDKSASYHIPGRAPRTDERNYLFSADASAIEGDESPEVWKVKNTAEVLSVPNTPRADGGVVIAEGEMGFWESTEIYPDNKPEIWGNLCGEKIRHHKFPDNSLAEQVYHQSQGGDKIRILGVKFENISVPVDNAGNPLNDIIGYEILRGSREGNKTVVAKGLLNNMRQHDMPDQPGVKGLYQNYPYNDLREDLFLTSNKSFIDRGARNNRLEDGLKEYRKDMFSFHSPDTSFSKPYLSASELKVYSEVYGTSEGSFKYVYKHPQFKLLSEAAKSTIDNLLSTLIATNLLTNAAKTIKFGGTEGEPFEFSLGGGVPTPGPPAAASDALGATGAATSAISIAAYVANLAIYTANVVALIYAAKLLKDQYSEKVINVVASMIPKRQFATQYDSHGFYSNYSINTGVDNARRKVADAFYIGDNLQSYNEYRINNLHRGKYVLVNTTREFDAPKIVDTSRNTKTQLQTDLNTTVKSAISGYYGAIKSAFPSQYGQLESIKQVPVYTCVYQTQPDKTKVYSTDVLFGGDIYIGRYTEKNPFLFFHDWLYDQQDELLYDYRARMSVAYPRYWLENTDAKRLVTDGTTAFSHLDDRHEVDSYVNRGHFYLFCNGVRDFFVESEVNLAYRDWDETPDKRHYDPDKYTDLTSMFRSDIMKKGNYYKYDYSLSVSKLYNNYVSWGSMQPRSYDPKVAEQCYSYSPNRIMYSLPQEQEQMQDNWVRFLPNNYIDMSGRVTALKSVGHTGALIMLENESPIMIQGVDSLQTDAGIKITVGDGGLFNQPMRNIMNTDDEYQYGSCQSKYAIVGIPAGVFWVSQEQGKIFQYAGQYKEISRNGNKWWFAKYLPSQLLKAFPNFAHYDNPLIGVGCNMSYDNTNEILYITKKDYKPINKDLKYDTINGFYTLGEEFIDNGVVKQTKTAVTLGDPLHFENASWTMSYDVKNEQFISIHDWHPNFIIPARSSFLTVQDKGVWRHNSRTDLYCNFYGVDYPFEVEYVASTGVNVATVKNVEYILECFKYLNDGNDKFHLLDDNFDRALVYNSEQVSGYLDLNLKRKDDPISLLLYPMVQSDSIKINYSKEENKYRFNQFWDITKNRGEFVGNEVPMFNVSSNGYTRALNPKYVDYKKSEIERKKFRHYANRVFLRKIKSGSTKMLFKIISTKLQISQR